MIIGAGAVAVLAAVTLIAEGISYFSAETVDTKEGLAIIKAAEKENVKDIEKKRSTSWTRKTSWKVRKQVVRSTIRAYFPARS
ncbi:MAG: hypothetical protein ACLU7M_10005 [Mediterraneibacter gnavus]